MKIHIRANAGHRYVYNEVTGNLDSETNRLDVTTTYKYNDVGAKIQEKFDIYEFNYIPHGELESVKISGKAKVSYFYNDENKLLSENYANGDTVRYEYDDNGNLARQYHNDDTSPYVTYSYNTDNELTKKVNHDTGLKYIYGENNSVSIYKLSDDTLVQSYTESKTEANEENSIESKTDVTESHFGDTYSYTTKNDSISYQYGDNSLTFSAKSNNESQTESDTVKFNGKLSLKSDYTYDKNSNIIKKSLNDSNSEIISVVNEYDDQNRITATGYNSVDDYFKYDKNGQLIYADNQMNNCTSTYSYDERGNILNINEYEYKNTNHNLSSFNDKDLKNTKTFTYSNDDWKDELTAVNGTPLTYDENGNVLTYGNKKFTWNTGRNLESIVDGNNKYSYTYDENGIRTSKTVNGKTTYYNTKDGVILSQTDGTDTLYFQYDNTGSPLGFIWNGTQYLYMTNQMGDVISITDEQGNELVQYEYNAWGKCVSTVTTHENDIEIKLSNINPIRYRGYYLDSETGYYYLQSRYYDSDICRFINEDILLYAILHKNDSSGLSVFVYSYNNPINRDDKNGFSSAGLVGSAFFYYFVTYVLPKIAGAVCYGVLFLSGVLFVYLLIKIVTDSLNDSGTSNSSPNNPKKPDDDSKIKKILKKIPNSLKKDGKVDLAKFDKTENGKTTWKSKNGWKISKDTAEHGGRKWKLLDRSGKRIASLGEDGSVLSK